MQGSCFLPATDSSCSSCLRSLLRGPRRERWRSRQDHRFGSFDLHALDFLAATSASHDLVEGSSDVLDEVESVGNLHCVGRTAASSIGISSAAITNDDLNAGMSL